MTDFNFSTISIRSKEKLIKQLKVGFFINVKDYEVKDEVEVEGRPDAFSILDPSDNTYVNIYKDTWDKKYRIYSWNETYFSIILDTEGNKIDTH